MVMPKIYLAGPEVFFPDSTNIGKKHKQICYANGFMGLYPLDNSIKSNTPTRTAKEIVKSNLKMIRSCDLLIANLSNFRGTKEHPSCDSGTAWECGYALSHNKRVIAYTDDIDSIPQKLINSIDLAIIASEFSDVFVHLNNIIFKDNHETITTAMLPKTFILDPISTRIQDVDPTTSFFLGYRFGKKMPCKATLSDTRTQVEKYGNIDQNGNTVENFGYSANIMIACTTKIINSSDMI